MLKNLRRRLAFVFTAFTGAVLAAVLVASFILSVRQTVQNGELWFANAVDTVAQTVVSSAVLGEEKTLYTDTYHVSVRRDGQVVPGLVVEDMPLAVAVGSSVELSAEDEAVLFQEAKSMAQTWELEGWVMESFQISAGIVEADSATDSGMAEAYAGDDTEDSASPNPVLVEEDSYLTAWEMHEEVVVETTQDGYEFYTSEGEGTSAMAAAEGDVYADMVQPDVVSITISPVSSGDGVFTLRYAGDSYRATYFTWPIAVEGEAGVSQIADYEFMVLEDLSGQNRRIVLNGLLHIGLLLGGLALLFLANWFLAKLVLRPTEEGMRRQTEFVAAASHELRSPLAVIRSSLSAAQAAKKEDEAQKYRAAAEQEAQRMTHLVDDLLLLAGGDAGSWQLNEAPVDLDTLLIDAAEVYRPLAKQKGASLALALPEETLPPVQGDAERLRQILAVLMDNALQYAPQNSTITLSAEQKKGKVRLSVADEGRGVPDEEKEKVFHRFYRADESRHDKSHFGLGLSVAKELAELHGGTLTVRDTKNGGATFVLTLPV